MEHTDREGFAAAVTAHGRAMFRAARAVLDGDADAEEAVGEAVLRAWERWGTLRDPEAVRPWLLKITVNCAHGLRRKNGRVTSMADMAQVAGTVEPPPVSGLWEAVCRLPRDSRAVVTLYYYEDMTVAEIARVLGVAQGTVKSRLSRARSRLKEMLREEG